MTPAGERVGNILNYADHAAASWSEKHTTLPQYRFAIRAVAVHIVLVSYILVIGAAALTAAFIRLRGRQRISESGFVD